MKKLFAAACAVLMTATGAWADVEPNVHVVSERSRYVLNAKDGKLDNVKFWPDFLEIMDASAAFNDASLILVKQ